MFKRFRFWLARKILPVPERRILNETKLDDRKFNAITDTFSGMDVKPWLILEDGTEWSTPEIHGFSIKWDRQSRKGAGTIISIALEEDLFAKLPSPVKDIKLMASNEYRQLGVMWLRNIKLTEARLAASIDDLITELFSDFEFTDIEPWRKWNFDIDATPSQRKARDIKNEALPS